MEKRGPGCSKRASQKPTLWLGEVKETVSQRHVALTARTSISGSSNSALRSSGKLRKQQVAGGFYSPRMQPPMVGGEGLARIDLVTQCDGLGSFEEEYANTVALQVDDFEIRVLKLERVIASKVAADRPKDRAVLDQLKTALAVIEALKG